VAAGSRVLDVACGNGNATLAAARRFCVTIGVDYVPALLARAQERAAAERLPIDFVEGDAEALPFPAESFDAVLSTFGVMFAPNHARSADELLRVTAAAERSQYRRSTWKSCSKNAEPAYPRFFSSSVARRIISIAWSFGRPICSFTHLRARPEF
jgi:ubiquinone/menaquinone biosynthesis C-methylase UbiE